MRFFNVENSLDYYSFGMLMPGRFSSSSDYRYGFNGYEKDDEVSGEGNSYDFGFRHYDSRVGRMKSVDPLVSSYPWQSPYVYHRNSPIAYIDYLGGGDPPKKVTTPDGGAMTLPSSSSTTTYDPNKTYSVGGKNIKVAEGSVQSFVYNDITYTAQFSTETGRFTRYLGTDGTELSYSTNTLPSVSNSGEYWSENMATAGVLAISDGPEPFVMDVVAGVYVIGTAIAAIWAIDDLLDDVSLTAPSLPIGGWVIDAPFAMPADYVSDDGVTTTYDPNGYITVFRGVHPDHPDYANALRGVATPIGGHSNPAAHNRGNNASVYTSWTVNPFVANHFATKQGSVSGGVVLIKKVHVSEITPSPDLFNQGEVLLKGKVTGATPVPAVKL